MKKIVAGIDGWLHYHRFNFVSVCFLHERLQGTSKALLEKERHEHRREHRLPHDVGRRQRRHPSAKVGV